MAKTAYQKSLVSAKLREIAKAENINEEPVVEESQVLPEETKSTEEIQEKFEAPESKSEIIPEETPAEEKKEENVVPEKEKEEEKEEIKEEPKKKSSSRKKVKSEDKNE